MYIAVYAYQCRMHHIACGLFYVAGLTFFFGFNFTTPRCRGSIHSLYNRMDLYTGGDASRFCDMQNFTRFLMG